MEGFRRPAEELGEDALKVTLAIADSWGGEDRDLTRARASASAKMSTVLIGPLGGGH